MRSDGVRVYHTKQRNTGERGNLGGPSWSTTGLGPWTVLQRINVKSVWYNLKSPNLLPRKKRVCQYVNDA